MLSGSLPSVGVAITNITGRSGSHSGLWWGVLVELLDEAHYKNESRITIKYIISTGVASHIGE